MSDLDSTATGIVEGAVSGLPAPVKTSLFKALSNLLGGLTAIPAAKLKQYAQDIEDTTTMRSTVAAIVAKATADESIKDPVLLQAAAEVYVPTALRKAKNRIVIAQKVPEYVSEAATDASEAAPPDDDWMNTFMRFAEDASSEKLQDLFARILAGQIVRPGSFRIATLRAVSELDHEIADDFSQIWAKSVGNSVDYSSEFYRGDVFSRWKRLVEAGFMAPTNTSQFPLPFKAAINGKGLWSPMQVNGTYLLVYIPEHNDIAWTHIEFTRVGREIGSIIARPDYEANIRAAGQRLAALSLVRVELHSTDKVVEVISEGLL